MKLRLLNGRFAISRLEPGSAVPAWAWSGEFCSVTRTADELSVVCAEQLVPEGTRSVRGWRGLAVQGPLDFSLVGILAGLSSALAAEGVSLFALSTFDTDYLLVKDQDLAKALDALAAAGHTVTR